MADRPNEEMQRYRLQLHQRFLLQAIFVTVKTLSEVLIEHLRPLYFRTPYHTSALSGLDWVNKLVTGHPDHIQNELGMNKQTFQFLLGVLDDLGFKSSRYVQIEEQVAIFLYTVVTGLTASHVGERFQRSTSTISKQVAPVLFLKVF